MNLSERNTIRMSHYDKEMATGQLNGRNGTVRAGEHKAQVVEWSGAEQSGRWRGIE